MKSTSFKSMNKRNYITAVLAVIVVLSLIVAGSYAYRQLGKSEKKENQDSGDELIGGQKDEHGCLVAAGYSWCEVKKKCLRTWEESCNVEPTESDIEAIKQAFIDKYNKSATEVQIEVNQFDGNFARGSVKFAMNGEFGAGGIFLAYKEGSVWKLAFDGNGGISCSEMESYNFPIDMISDCYEDESNEASDNAQIANPASVYCSEQGGQLEIQSRKIGQYGVCLFEDNRQCEEWALYRGQCPVGGLKIAGYENEAEVYCAITGGQVEGVGTETPMCKRSDGTYCNAQANFDGDCPDPNDPNPSAGNREVE